HRSAAVESGVPLDSRRAALQAAARAARREDAGAVVPAAPPRDRGSGRGRRGGVGVREVGTRGRATGVGANGGHESQSTAGRRLEHSRSPYAPSNSQARRTTPSTVI